MTQLENGLTELERKLEEAQARINVLKDALISISSIENNLYGGDWDEIEEARAIAFKALSTTSNTESLDRVVREAVEKERERCANVCELRYMGDNNREDMEAKRCEEAIRKG